VIGLLPVGPKERSAIVRADLLKWMFLLWTGTALTVIGLSLSQR